jgi:predicted lipid-binding transport protein (Tim44 family)
MNYPLTLLVALITVFALVGHDDADARRMGGGRSFGAQRSFTPPPVTAPNPRIAPNPVMPAQPGMANAAKAPVAGATAARSGASRWLGPIAGIAAGLGLAALLSHLGLSPDLGGLLLVLLLVGGGVLLIRALARRNGAATARPYGYAGAAGATRADASNAGTSSASRYEPVMRPEQSGSRFEPVMPSAPASSFEPAWGGAGTASDGRFPPGFDPAPFAAEAKRQFVRLQQAYDRNDRKLLAELLTPDMLDEIGREIDGRGAHVPTQVDGLDAEVLEARTEDDRHWVSVRFTGRTREDGRSIAEPLDEVWNLVKPVDGASGWRLAGIQQYA